MPDRAGKLAAPPEGLPASLIGASQAQRGAGALEAFLQPPSRARS